MGSDPVLVIMAKAPRAGAVKTRLIPAFSPEAVAAFYSCLLDDTLTLARSLGGVHVAIVCTASDAIELARFAGSGVTIVAQTGQGLAAGLASAFASFASDGPRGIVAFNSDSPHLPRPVLEHAFDMLASHDMVVGPAHDGGYYLVGATASYPSLFSSDGMGTGSALERLLSRASALGLSVAFTDPFDDIDVAEDVTRLAATLGADPLRAPRTAAWLKEREFLAAGCRRTKEQL